MQTYINKLWEEQAQCLHSSVGDSGEEKKTIGAQGHHIGDTLWLHPHGDRCWLQKQSLVASLQNNIGTCLGGGHLSVCFCSNQNTNLIMCIMEKAQSPLLWPWKAPVQLNLCGSSVQRSRDYTQSHMPSAWYRALLCIQVSERRHMGRLGWGPYSSILHLHRYLHFYMIKLCKWMYTLAASCSTNYSAAYQPQAALWITV